MALAALSNKDLAMLQLAKIVKLAPFTVALCELNFYTGLGGKAKSFAGGGPVAENPNVKSISNNWSGSQGLERS